MQSSMKFLVVLFFALTSFSYAHAANPSIKTTFKYYKIKGDTAQNLKRQMKRKGPRGYWAYAKWNVKWSSKCKVKVSIKITMPQWQNKSEAPATLQKKWSKMISALKKHELNHGNHGINAAKELVSKKCKNAKKIVRKWAKQDKIYDRKTNHGRKEGVRL